MRSLRFSPWPLLLAAALSGLAVPGPTARGEAVEPSMRMNWRAELHRDHPLVGVLWSRVLGRAIAVKELDPALGAADFLLLGEQHDNPDHHLLQALVIERLVALGRPPAVALEMLPAGELPDLASYAGEAARLGDFLGWEERGWPAWSLYEPLGGSILRHGLPLHGADVAPERRKAVGRKGLTSLPQEELRRLALAEPLAAGEREKLLAALEEGHCGLVPREALEAMENVQRLRDATLADSLLAVAGAAGAAPVVLIAGAGHVRSDHGVPWYMARRAPEAELLRLLFVEVVPGEERPADYPLAEAADYLWFTPAAERGDPCAELRRRFGGG